MSHYLPEPSQKQRREQALNRPRTNRRELFSHQEAILPVGFR
jgi:hypothetical protein